MRSLNKSIMLILFAALFAAPAVAQSVGTCTSRSATKDLDANNVRARLYNNGGIFWKGSGNVYTVPKNGEANSIFASGIWVGGLDAATGQPVFAGTDYGPAEFWPGPLDAAGNPPANCADYDRIFKITKEDLDRYNQTGQATGDIRDWPYDLGAPVVDGDGDPENYNLAGGDRPELIGNQTIWWIMNDVGNAKGWSNSPPIGLEVQTTAFAFLTSDDLNNATFYKMRIAHKGSSALNQAYLGLWSDPDLGNAADDFVGSDTTLGVGFVYNGTNNDQGFDGYGVRPPALGYDFFQGPLVPAPGQTWVDPDGTEHPDMKRLPMTRFVYYNNDSTPQGNPDGTADAYNYLRGIWRDGSPMTVGGAGFGGTEPTNFMFPGDPVTQSFWSEENTDGAGARNTPSDRRFLMSTGPFTMNPGDVQELVFGIVWAQADDRLSSVAAMKNADLLAQAAFDVAFELPAAPDAPTVEATETDGQVILTWEYGPQSNNFADTYDVFNLFLQDVPDDEAPDKTYTFEGYNVFRYPSRFATEDEGELIATFDVPNDVGIVVDVGADPGSGTAIDVITARGDNSGVAHSMVFDNLVNYTDYYFGVQAYAYNEFSSPKVLKGPVTRITVTPSKVDGRSGGTVLATDALGADFLLDKTGAGDGFVTANVVDPGKLTGDTYRLTFTEIELPAGKTSPEFHMDQVARAGVSDADPSRSAKTLAEDAIITYNLVNETDGVTLMDGQAFFDQTGRALPQVDNILTVDGLEFSIVGAPPEIACFVVTSNASGPLPADNLAYAAYAFNSSHFPECVDNDADGTLDDRPLRGYQQSLSDEVWGWHTGGNQDDRASFEQYIDRTLESRGHEVADLVPNDWEIRFTEECRTFYDTHKDTPSTTAGPGCWSYTGFGWGDIIPVPFELWNGGPTPNDPSDDIRMIPYVIDWDSPDPLWDMQCWDHEISGGDNDPETDWIYWHMPADDSPGDAGYRAWETAALALAAGPRGWPSDADPGSGTTTQSFFGVESGGEVMGRVVLVAWNMGSEVDDCDFIKTQLPEAGTTFRLATSKPNQPGDTFVLSTDGLGVVTGDAATAQENLEQIGIVPNPYKGASAYEVNALFDQVRFTNLPDRATVRVFNLAGTLVRQLELGTNNNTWNLTTDDGLPLASGMYLVHVEVDGVGERVLKFGVVKKRIQLDLF